jgi:hypothetical protein
MAPIIGRRSAIACQTAAKLTYRHPAAISLAKKRRIFAKNLKKLEIRRESLRQTRKPSPRAP